MPQPSLKHAQHVARRAGEDFRAWTIITLGSLVMAWSVAAQMKMGVLAVVFLLMAVVGALRAWNISSAFHRARRERLKSIKPVSATPADEAASEGDQA